MTLKKAIIFLTLFIITGISTLFFLSTLNYKSRVIMGGKTFTVDVADTYLTQKQGLSERKPIGNKEGMFFIFEKSDKYGFWMKDMLFSIDIIWIDENFKIVHIEKNVSPKTYPSVFYPETPARYVLEVSSGQADLLKILVGDEVNFLDKNLN